MINDSKIALHNTRLAVPTSVYLKLVMRWKLTLFCFIHLPNRASVRASCPVARAPTHEQQGATSYSFLTLVARINSPWTQRCKFFVIIMTLLGFWTFASSAQGLRTIPLKPSYSHHLRKVLKKIEIYVSGRNFAFRREKIECNIPRIPA